MLGEKLNNNAYNEDGITVKRLWKRNSWLTFPNLFLEILKNNRNTKKVLIQFGLAAYGDVPHLLLWPFFLFALKLLGKDIYIVFHEVITDINNVYGHINLKPNSSKAKINNIFIRAFYSLSIMLSAKVFVLEEELKENLKDVILIRRLAEKDLNKISVIPIGVEEFTNVPTKDEARKKVNDLLHSEDPSVASLLQDDIRKTDFVILCFGFLAWYKGTDWIIDKIKDQKSKIKDIKLIVAGGANPNRVNHAFYRKYVEDLEKKCNDTGITLTGFVKEEDIPDYFQAADLIVFPYRALMGSAATLSLAYSFKKPFLVSGNLSGIFKTNDLKGIMSKFQLTKDELCFKNEDEFYKKIEKIKNNKDLENKICNVSKEVAKARNWQDIGIKYYREIIL
ncbi:MAG: glycosyltransferase [Patescibacteria group bacterium]|nr:glycosyltransferase [Patescibacteria group bacterium]